jgi:hypothetical protein
MYNRILKRPMFMRGGMGYSAQGTGITSGMDTPRPRYYGGGTIGGGMIQGNPMGYRTGFNEPVMRTEEDIQTDIESMYAPKKGEWLNDVISSFGVYSNMRNPDGSYKTTGEAGFDQAQMIDKIRTEREDKRKLAELSGYERELKNIDLKKEQDFEMSKMAKSFEYDTFLKNLDQKGAMALAQYEGGVQMKIAELAKQNTATGRRLKDNDDLLQEKLAEAGRLPPGERENAIAAAKAEHRKLREEILGKTNLMDAALKIAAGLSKDSMKSAEDILTDILIIIQGLQSQNLRSGGRVGYQMGTPQTGAMPMQPVQASVTETIDTPGEDMMMTETVTEGQQPTVQMPYEEFRAAIPAEVNDDIVQLIYYNQDAFADFAQISTQADVYAFNNKYGVSLVLPMDTETT